MMERACRRTGFGSRATWITCCALLIVGCSASATAQGKPEKKDDDKGETYTGKLVNIEGALHCQKPDPTYALEVPDRPGHALTLAHRKCSWTEPWTIAEAKPKEGVAVNFAEQMEGVLHTHGFEVDTLDTGDKITFRTMGQISPDKAPAQGKGRWSFMRGTGKFKGIRGGGTYEVKLESDESLTLKLEGVYVPAEMAAGPK